MVIDAKTEDCRQCTLKHLSTALVTLADEDIPDILKRVYFCGHLSHAANHFVHISEDLAEEIRVLRLDAQNDRLEFLLAPDVMQTRLTGIINSITTYQPPPVEPAAEAETLQKVTAAAPGQKRGCPCKNRQK